MIVAIAFGAACGTTVANVLALRKLKAAKRRYEDLAERMETGLEDVRKLQQVWRNRVQGTQPEQS